MYCSKCGKENKESARFCAFCGAPMGEEINRHPEHNAGQKKASRTKKVFLISLSVLTILVAATIAMSVFILPKQREKRYQAELDDGNRYLEEMNYEKAEASYLAAIDVEPKQEEPYLKLAEIYNVQNEPEKATEILKQGVKATDGAAIREKYSLYTYVDDVLVPEMGRCEEGEYISKYVRTSHYVAVEPVHSQKGVITSRIRDFDNDEKEELLVLVMKNDERVETLAELDRNVVYIRMYEAVKGEIILQDEFRALYPVMGAGDMEDSGIFFQTYEGKIYICGSTYTLNYVIADGSSYNSFVMFYNGSGFERLSGTEETLAGSEFSWDEQNANDMADYLDSIGLANEAQQIRGSWIRSFDFSDPSEEMILRITGDNDGTADFFEFHDTMDAETLGTVVFYLQTSWEDGKDEDISDGSEQGETETKNEIELTSEVYNNAYGPVLDRTIVEYGNDIGAHLLYYVYDIDKNGVKELLLQTGTCEADFMYEIYTIESESCKYLGEIPGSHTSFFADENGGTESYIIQMQAHMGYEGLYRISLQDGAPVSEEMSSRQVPADDEYYSNDYPLQYAYISDRSNL